jgi:hypothetical protein
MRAHETGRVSTDGRATNHRSQDDIRMGVVGDDDRGVVTSSGGAAFCKTTLRRVTDAFTWLLILLSTVRDSSSRAVNRRPFANVHMLAREENGIVLCGILARGRCIGERSQRPFVIDERDKCAAQSRRSAATMCDCDHRKTAAPCRGCERVGVRERSGSFKSHRDARSNARRKTVHRKSRDAANSARYDQ